MPALSEYRRKRDFRVTAEPMARAPRRRRDAQRIFVVQLHHARARHYDFRLELGGVLKSWAVPKGPSFDPGVKRLAVEVEDHPLDYAEFEGEIPRGQYGAGSVRIFDRGNWDPLGSDDAAAQLRKGHLEFELHGGKLRGAWHLVRTRRAGRRQQWLLFKARDRWSGSTEADDLVGAKSTRPRARRSAASRSAAAVRVAAPRRRTGSAIEAVASNLPGAIAKPLPAGAFAPQLAMLVATAPAGDDWLHEVKWDGYRLLATIRGGEPTLWSRNAIEWTARVPAVAEALRALGVDARLDGELIALVRGRSDFNALQRALSGARDVDLVYVVFDLLQVGDWSIAGCALEDRKRLLQELLATQPSPNLQFSEHRVGGGDAMFAQAARRGLEGIVSKRRAAPYRPGRSDDWRKVKTVASDEFAIVGYTEPKGSRTGLGSLLLATPDGSGGWRYVGRVGSGFSHAQLGELARRLEREQRADPPVRRESIGATLRNAHWVEPRIAAEIYYRGIGNLGLLRQPSLKAIRADKSAADLLREGPLGGSKPKRTVAARADPRVPPRARKRPTRSVRAAARAASVAGAAMPIRLTHPERVVFPDGFTKADVANYYIAVMPQLLAAVRHRPLSIIRCPEGIAGQCFFQKHVTRGLKRVGIVPIREESGKTGDYVFADDAAAVLELVQFNALEFHPWAATVDDPEHTDYVVFDLDPAPDVGWKQVVDAAECVHRRCREAGLEAFVRTTGGKGLHVVVPLRPAVTWAAAKDFAHELADRLAADEPDRFVAQAAKNRRVGRIFVDWLRNARGATSVASYSLRARAGAPVATPLRWEELRRIDGPAAFDLRSVPARLRRLRSDPWRNFYTLQQALPASGGPKRAGARRR